jgi:hypothetical protein
MMGSGRCDCGQSSAYRQISYVRNDPVNLVDPHGRDVTQTITVWGTLHDVFLVPASLADFFIRALMPPQASPANPYLSSMAQAMAENARAEQAKAKALAELQAQLDDKAGLKSDMENKKLKGACLNFIQGVIDQLKEMGKVSADFSTSTLINNVLSADRQAKWRSNIRNYANADTYDNTMIIAADPINSNGNDVLSTVLHEAFHLAITAKGARILDDVLYQAVAVAAGGHPLELSGMNDASIINGREFGQRCGSNFYAGQP